MILGGQLKTWFTKFQRYKVTYKNGFFGLSHLANSPYTIIESFDKMPFCSHSREDQLLTCNTPFLDGKLYYTRLEEGLWMCVSDCHFKKNIEVHNIFDKSLPVEFNFLSLYYNTTTIKSKNMLVNGLILTDKTWWVFKAGSAAKTCHFKDSDEFNLTIYFTDEWFSRQVKQGNYFANSRLEKFFKSANTYAIMQDNEADSNNFYSDFLTLSKQNKSGLKNKEISVLMTDIFRNFTGKYAKEDIADEYFKLTDADRKHIQKTEKYLMDNLLISFPGIENIAKKVGVSPTKLKDSFKIVHNKGLYQYYRSHQMTLASKLLTEKARTVKEVANLLGYENASKFATVFKEQFGVQPSALIRQTN